MATLATTTLASEASANDTLIYVASSSGITSASYVCVDREVMNVVSVPASGVLAVDRGDLGSQTAHASGSTVYVGSATDFHTVDPVGPPPATEPGLPWINVTTGQHWLITDGAWVPSVLALQLGDADGPVSDAVLTISAGEDTALRATGVDRGDGTYYLTSIDGSIPGIRTNGYVTINGASGDPVPNEIAGHSSYMLGIGSDVGANPTVVIKTSTGSLIEGYDGADNNIFEVDANGYVTSARFKTANNYVYETSSTQMAVNNGFFVPGDVSIGSASAQRTFQIDGGNIVALKINANDGGTDGKRWAWQAGSAVGAGVLRLRVLNDAESNGANAIVITRSGISITSVALGGLVIAAGTPTYADNAAAVAAGLAAGSIYKTATGELRIVV